VKVARDNSAVNWVIKIHPANVAKAQKERFVGIHAEVRSLQKLGPLPPHIRVLPPDTRISTRALFPVMDFCLTVRGTVGIEAAARGIPVLTAGTGRYDRKGFTIDSDSAESYRTQLTNIETLKPLSADRRELAERYAYALFLMRPLRLTSATFEFARDSKIQVDQTKTRVQTNVRSQINITALGQWNEAPDLGALAKWIAEARNSDFLVTPCGNADHA
jgi:hypothetical protein